MLAVSGSSMYSENCRSFGPALAVVQVERGIQGLEDEEWSQIFLFLQVPGDEHRKIVSRDLIRFAFKKTCSFGVVLCWDLNKSKLAMKEICILFISVGRVACALFLSDHF